MTMLRIGFTGTRQGLSDVQHLNLYEEIKRLSGRATHAHHGCAIGADDEFAQLAATCLEPGRIIVGHPSNIPSQTSERAVRNCTEVRPAKPPLERNKDIVAACGILLACPAGPEELRSGTWATCRYARKVGRPIVIIWPSGEIAREEAAC
jgi:hypothetical protein